MIDTGQLLVLRELIKC